MRREIKSEVIDKLKHSRFFNFSFEVFSKISNYISPLTWDSYYVDPDMWDKADRERKFVSKYTSDGLEKHLLHHLTSAAECNMDGSFKCRDYLINNYTYDLAVASILKIKLNPKLLESKYSTDLIMSVHLPIKNSVYDHSRMFSLSKCDYADEISKLFELKAMDKLRVRGYVLGHDFNISEISEDNHSLPSSIIDCCSGIQNVPIYSSPLFILKNNLFNFSNTKDETVSFPLSRVDEIRDCFSKKTINYQRELTGVENPDSKKIRDSILKCNNFAKLLSSY